jgi:hypothetical protein
MRLVVGGRSKERVTGQPARSLEGLLAQIPKGGPR